MKIKISRTYFGARSFTRSSYEMGQNFGRVRLMPQEAATRRELSRWHRRERMATSLMMQIEADRSLSSDGNDTNAASAVSMEF